MDSQIAAIHDEIRAGLSNERDRLKDAHDNRRFADGCFEEYPTREENSPYQRLDYRRTSSIMGRVIDILTHHLYKASPTRQFNGDPKASEWLERVYRRNAMLPMWQEADRLTHIGDLAAFQFAGDTDPLSPVKVHLWGADQLVWWLDPDDQRRPIAVGALDYYDARRRLTLWTADEVSVYLTDKDGGRTVGGTAYRLDSSASNPYLAPNGIGILPFSFVHYKFPATDFHTRGPGGSLRRLNDYVNFDLDDMGDGKRYGSKPIGLAEGVDAGWTPPGRLKPGMFITLPPTLTDVMANGVAPTLRYLEQSSDWLARNWFDLQSYIDHCLEMEGVPPGTIRLSGSATSGIQVIGEQLPLLTRTEGRRIPFAAYEAEAARVAILVGSAHLRNHGMADKALEAIAADPSLAMGWPNLYALLPGPERNDDDEWLLRMGIKDKVEVLMQREGLSEEQAFERLKVIVARNAKLKALGIDPGIADLPLVQSSSNAAPADAV